MAAKDYFSKFRKTVERHLREWPELPGVQKITKGRSISTMERYCRGEADSCIISTSSNGLTAWHIGMYAVYRLDSNRAAGVELATAARFASATVEFEHAFAKDNRGGPMLLRDAALFFALNVICGDLSNANAVGLRLYRGMDSALLNLRKVQNGGEGSLFRHFWFLLLLFCDIRKLPIDTSQWAYPADMSPYAQVLADWRTNDLKRVDNFVSEMCNFHLSEARFNDDNDEISEFDTEDRMLFPYEILTYLRLREWTGLENPTSFSHLLMNQPLAVLPVPLPQTDTPLLDAVVQKFKEEFPDSFSA